jgi:hypothetical protein
LIIQPVRSVNFDDVYTSADVQVAPNPFTGTTSISVSKYNSSAGTNYNNQCRCTDFSLQKEMYLKEGDSRLDLSTNEWPAGVYFLHITTPYWSKVVKLVKQ